MKAIELQRVHGKKGDIFVFEDELFDFPIRRVYFTTNVPPGQIRGHHAHKTLEQILVCPCGTIEVTLDDGKGGIETVCLDRPEKGLYVGPSVWRTIKWLAPNSLLLVFASQPYEESDYIRDYEQFRVYAASL